MLFKLACCAFRLRSSPVRHFCAEVLEGKMRAGEYMYSGILR